MEPAAAVDLLRRSTGSGGRAGVAGVGDGDAEGGPGAGLGRRGGGLLRSGDPLRRDGDAAHDGAVILRQIGERNGADAGGGGGGGSLYLKLPLDIAGIGTRQPGSGGVAEGLRPVAPGLVRAGGVAGASTEDDARAGEIAAPLQAAPTSHRAGIEDRRFVPPG